MRSIFIRLFLSFSLIILLSALVSGLVLFSFSRRSMKSFHDDFKRQQHVDIARSVVLMGEAAHAIHQYRDTRAFADYVEEIDRSMRTRIFLVIGDDIWPHGLPPVPGQDVTQLLAAAGTEEEPFIHDSGQELIVAQRQRAPDGRSYGIVGMHRFRPPPGPAPFGPRPDRPPPPEHDNPLTRLFGGPEMQTLVLLIAAGLVCFFLARSFSAPLIRLRQASRRLADGDLTARVDTGQANQTDELTQLGLDFNHMAEQIEGLVNARQRLLLDISHELRSPLARLDLALALAKIRFGGEGDDLLDRITRESTRLNELIGQLLTLTRLASQQEMLEMTPVHLAELVLEISKDAQFEGQFNGTKVLIGEMQDVMVNGCHELLHQAVENVVRNAIRYTRPDSKVALSLSLECATIGQPSVAVLRVRDHGPGVPDAFLAHVFEPFFRVAEARDRTSGGTGLGLAIARQAVLRHGGTITLVNAQDGDGLIADIRLPLGYEPVMGTAVP